MDSELEQLLYELHAADLYDEHYRLLERMAMRYAVNKEDETEINSLIQMGWIGLIVADAHFKKDCGVSFISFAIHDIRRFMKLYLTWEEKK